MVDTSHHAETTTTEHDRALAIPTPFALQSIKSILMISGTALPEFAGRTNCPLVTGVAACRSTFWGSSVTAGDPVSTVAATSRPRNQRIWRSMMSVRFTAMSGRVGSPDPKYSFLVLGHTSLNYVYAEQHHRELLAEAERERQLALGPASPFTWASVFSVVKAGLQALLLVRTRATNSEVSTPSQSHADKPQFHRPDQLATVLGREPRGRWLAIAGDLIGGNEAHD
jgi:hypothetical protein